MKPGQNPIAVVEGVDLAEAEAVAVAVAAAAEIAMDEAADAANVGRHATGRLGSTDVTSFSRY